MANGFNFGGGGDNAFNRQRLLGQMLLRGSQNTQNITSPFQVAGNLAQAFVGTQMLGSAQEQEQQRQQELARVLQGATGALTADNAPARPGAPGGGSRQDRIRGATRMLASNPQTAPMALEMGLQQAQQEPQGQSTILTGQQVNEQFGANVDPGGLFRVNPQTMEFEQVAEGQGGDLTQTERQVQRLRQRGFSRADAEDIAFGRMNVITDDFGRTFLVNEATGERRLASGQRGGRQPASEGEVELGRIERAGEGRGRNRELEEAAREGTGPFAMAKDFANRTIGAVIQGEPFPETTEARQRLRIYNQQIKQTLTANPRNPVAELKTIQGFLPDPDSFFTDPDAEVRRLRELKGFLMRRRDLNAQQLDNTLLSNRERKRLVDQNAQIAQALELMETFGAEMPGQEESQQEQAKQDGGGATIRFERDEEGNLVPVQ